MSSPNLSSPEKPYRFLEHMTDAEIEAYGSTLEQAFENAGKALEDTMVDITTIQASIEQEIRVQGKDLQELLYAWLDSLIFQQDTQQMLYSKFICRISRGKNPLTLDANVGGEKYDPKKHEAKTAIKAATYHNMIIEENSDQRRVTLRFLLDL